MILTLSNLSGSAGKSTTLIEIARIAADHGYRVLVVDADANQTATSWLDAEPSPGQLTVSDVLLARLGTGHEVAVAAVVAATSLPGVHIIPATVALGTDALGLLHQTAGDRRLALALNSLTPVYDLILVDSPGSPTAVPLIMNALTAATHTLTVFAPGTKEKGGIDAWMKTVDEVRIGTNPGLTVAGIVPCAVPPANAGRDYADNLRAVQEAYPDLTTPTIRRSVTVEAAFKRRRPLRTTDPVHTDYLAVWDWLTTHTLTLSRMVASHDPARGADPHTPSTQSGSLDRNDGSSPLDTP